MFLLSFPLSLPFDWTLRCWVCVCCFVLFYFGYCVVCEKKKKKIVDNKKKEVIRYLKCFEVAIFCENLNFPVGIFRLSRVAVASFMKTVITKSVCCDGNHAESVWFLWVLHPTVILIWLDYLWHIISITLVCLPGPVWGDLVRTEVCFSEPTRKQVPASKTHE